MRPEPSIHEQRNRLYRSLPPFGTLSGGRVLEESRKLDALVLRYYRTMGSDAPTPPDRNPAREAGDTGDAGDIASPGEPEHTS